MTTRLLFCSSVRHPTAFQHTGEYILLVRSTLHALLRVPKDALREISSAFPQVLSSLVEVLVVLTILLLGCVGASWLLR